MSQKLLIYLTTSVNVCLYRITHRPQDLQKKAREERLQIKVFNYRQKLPNKSSCFLLLDDKKKAKKILRKSHVVCLQRESVSEARMDVFQVMV